MLGDICGVLQGCAAIMLGILDCVGVLYSKKLLHSL